MTIAITPPRSHASMNIRTQLMRRIGRQWKPGDRLPPIRELANDLGSGYVSTHRAIKMLTDAGLLVARDRVGVFVSDDIDMKAIREDVSSAAQPGPHVARPLAGMRVHVFAPQKTNRLFDRQYESMRDRLREHYCDVETFVVDMLKSDWLDMTEHSCEAVAVVGPILGHELKVNPHTAMVMSYQGRIDYPTAVPQVEIDGVTVDQHHGGMLAGQCLREAGVSSVCFIGRQYKNHRDHRAPRPNYYDAISTIRLQGFEVGFGPAVPKSHQIMVSTYSPVAAARIVPSFLELDPRPQAVFTATDELAIGFIHGTQAHGIEPGRDYQIIGFDGQDIGRDLLDDPLTTIDIPAEEMGRRAADLLAERILKPDLPRRQLNLGCTLFTGETVRPHKTK